MTSLLGRIFISFNDKPSHLIGFCGVIFQIYLKSEPEKMWFHKLKKCCIISVQIIFNLYFLWSLHLTYYLKYWNLLLSLLITLLFHCTKLRTFSLSFGWTGFCRFLDSSSFLSLFENSNSWWTLRKQSFYFSD